VSIPILILALAVATTPPVWWLLNRSTVLRSRLHHRVVVTLKSGPTFDGVLCSADQEAWVLRSAHAISAGQPGANVPVDGEVLILTADIEYAQRP
jgi:small nuclear ribonucleoprotein (snRNP)-like protein